MVLPIQVVDGVVPIPHPHGDICTDILLCGEGLVLRMGEAAVLLTQSSVRLLLQQLTGSFTTPTEDSQMVGPARSKKEYFPLDGADDKEPLTAMEIQI